MKIKKLYTFTNKKKIWRLLPTKTGKLVIEERDPDLKEAYFSCIEINSGKSIFNCIMLEEKFWVGIEKIHNDIIYFHKFKKPDMPGHLGIIAFDIQRKEILWNNEKMIFLFAYGNEVFCYKESAFGGEGRTYFKLNYKTGEVMKELGNNPAEINLMKDRITEEENSGKYYFTKQFISEAEPNKDVKEILADERNRNLVSGKIDYLLFKNLLLYSMHEILPVGNELRNIFKTVDINKGKVIFEEELNREVKSFLPDSFFIKDDLLFLLKEKTELLVCSIRE